MSHISVGALSRTASLFVRLMSQRRVQASIVFGVVCRRALHRLFYVLPASSLSRSCVQAGVASIVFCIACLEAALAALDLLHLKFMLLPRSFSVM